MAKAKNQALIPWEEQMQQDAQIAQAMEASAAGGGFFSVKGGILSFGGAPLPGNKMAVVILDSILQNTFYEGKYDLNNPTGPSCYAFARAEGDLAPHADAPSPQNAGCSGCQWNEFGSADTGKGKACKNGRRLALIPAGEFDKNDQFKLITDPAHYKKAAIGYLLLPPTSVKPYASFVNQLATTLRRPPYGVVTKIYPVPDSKSQFKIIFEAVDTLGREVVEEVIPRAREAAEVIAFPYPKYDDEPALPPAATPRQRQARAVTPPARQAAPRQQRQQAQSMARATVPAPRQQRQAAPPPVQRQQRQAAPPARQQRQVAPPQRQASSGGPRKF